MFPTEEHLHEVGGVVSQPRELTLPSSPKVIQTPRRRIDPSVSRRARITPAAPLMLTALGAWHYLCAKTGGTISLQSFYRWIRSGRVCAIRMGRRFYVPVGMLDEVIKRCLDGEEF